MAISSMIGDVSGMICDGASNSCAMKVSTQCFGCVRKAVLMALDDTAVTSAMKGSWRMMLSSRLPTCVR
ncbi:L-serine ammonia-lyase, iron-sulfur-dependent, subunit alpha [Escherichia coli]